MSLAQSVHNYLMQGWVCYVRAAMLWEPLDLIITSVFLRLYTSYKSS